jgi:thioredoxin 2
MADTVIRCEVCGRRNRAPAAATGTLRCGQCSNPLPWIADADDETFHEVAEAASLPVLLDSGRPGAARAGW